MCEENDLDQVNKPSKRYFPYKSEKDAATAAEKYLTKSLRQFQRVEIIERLRVSGKCAAGAVPILAGIMHRMDMSDRHALADLFMELVREHNVDLSGGAEELSRFLTESNRVLRDKIKDLLIEMGPAAELALKRALGCIRHERSDIKIVGAEVLGAIGPICAEQVIPKLESIAKTPRLDSEVVDAFMDCLSKVRGKETDKEQGNAATEKDEEQKQKTESANIPQKTKDLCVALLKEARVLVVDDESKMRFLIAKTIAKSAFKVSEAQDGAQALELLRKAARRNASYDVVLMDLQMPIMNGLQAISEIRNDELLKDTPVIVVSAYRDPKAIAKAAELGVSGYILKPYKVTEILVKIYEVLMTAHHEK